MKKKTDDTTSPLTFTAMVEVYSLTKDPEIVDLQDFDSEKIYRGIYLNGFFNRPVRVGDCYLVDLTFDGVSSLITECGPQYETWKWVEGEDEEDEDSLARDRAALPILRKMLDDKA